VGLNEIEYKKFDNPDGQIFNLPKSDVFLILYENGTKDVFDADTRDEVVDFKNNGYLFLKGQTDTLAFYDGYKGAGTGTLIVSLISPLAGLVPAIACSATPPKVINLSYPNSDLMSKPDYSNGYKLRSKKIKQGKVWKNWGIALGVNLAAILILTSSAR
jgi:hypothetical protein